MFWMCIRIASVRTWARQKGINSQSPRNSLLTVQGGNFSDVMMLCIFTFMQNAKKSFMYIKNSENPHFGQFSNDTLHFYANRNKAEPREVTKQVIWIILRNRIFHRTIRHIRSGFPSYARTLCALTLFAYALNSL